MLIKLNGVYINDSIYDCSILYSKDSYYIDFSTSSDSSLKISCGDLIEVSDSRYSEQFRIASFSNDGSIISYSALHLSNDLDKFITSYMTTEETSIYQASSGIFNHIIGSCNFSVSVADGTYTSGTFKMETPGYVSSELIKGDDSVISVFGAYPRYSGNKITLYSKSDRSPIRTLISKYHYSPQSTFDWEECYGTGSPVYTTQTSYVKYDDVIGSEDFSYRKKVLDVNSYMEAPEDYSGEEWIPTADEVKTATKEYLAKEAPWDVDKTYVLNSINELKAYPQPYDLIQILDPDLGKKVSYEVTEIEYDALGDRYLKVEFSNEGDFGDQIGSIEITATVSSTGLENVKKEIEDYQNKFKTRFTGYVTINQAYEYDSEGHVIGTHGNEILIMDTQSISTAQNVIRINEAGIGFSTSGYNPSSFTTCWTIDGNFNANFIGAGTFTANYIYGGTMNLGLVSGVSGSLTIANSSNVKYMEINSSGLKFYQNGGTAQNTAFSISSEGVLHMDSLTLTGTISAGSLDLTSMEPFSASNVIKEHSISGDKMLMHESLYGYSEGAAIESSGWPGIIAALDIYEGGINISTTGTVTCDSFNPYSSGYTFDATGFYLSGSDRKAIFKDMSIRTVDNHYLSYIGE